ncbi:hypothetical protein AVDCRST_MAG84-5643, partial [uncultured Microcoleus sp.]
TLCSGAPMLVEKAKIPVVRCLSRQRRRYFNFFYTFVLLCIITIVNIHKLQLLSKPTSVLILVKNIQLVMF